MNSQPQQQQQQQQHVVCVPFPSPGHIGPMLKLAKLLHSKGFFITFLNTQLNHQRLLESSTGSTSTSTSVNGVPSFRFVVVSEWEHIMGAKGIHVLCNAVMTKFLDPFKELLSQINDQACSGSGSVPPPVSFILADCMMAFALDAAQQLGNIPVTLFWTASAAGFLGYSQYRTLLNKGIVPFKGSNYLTDGSLDMVVDWVPSMRGILLKYIPTFMRTTDKDDIMFNLHMSSVERAAQSFAPIIFNTFDALEHEVFEDLFKIILGPIFTIGPLHLLRKDETTEDSEVESLGGSFWKEDSQCLDWLDTKNPNSVVYVSFGSITTMTNDNLVEFAWGLAKSKHPFLWIVRPNLVSGDTAVIPPEFLAETKDRGLLVSWCDQEKVLNHPSIGAFLTHCGWNSTLDSICGGVPMLCSPFFAEQQTNCWFNSEEWGIGMELSSFGRAEVEKRVNEIMEGEGSFKMRRKAEEWKNIADEAATSQRGSSYINFDKLINQVLLPLNQHHN